MKQFFHQLSQRIFSYDDGTLPEETSRNMRTIIISVLIGTFCFNVTGGASFTGYIKALGASDLILSVLVAMPFVMRFLQLFASYILERTKARKGLFVGMGIISRSLWLLVALVPFFVPMEHQAVRLWMVLVLYTMISCTGLFIDTTFLSMVADVVPMRLRGRFFSVRSRLSMVVGIICGLIIGFILDNVQGHDGLLGYIICFSLAAVFGLGDILCYIRMKFPPMEEGEATRAGAKKPSMPAMVKEVLQNKPFMKLVGFWTCWSFAMNLMAPFFNVYMLEYIQMSYIEITLFCTVPANIMGFFLLRRWGNAMDEHGYRPVLTICTLVQSFIPLLWLFCGPRFYVFVVIAQIFAGIVGSAVDLSSQNTIMNAAPSRNRSMYTAVHMVVTQLLGVALGFVTGGFLLDNVFTPLAQSMTAAGITLAGLEITQYHFLLVLSTVVRLAATLVLRKTDIEGNLTAGQMLGGIGKGVIVGVQRRYAMIRAQRLRRKYRKNNSSE